MSKDINIADITVHLHPKTSSDDREKIEQALREQDGVVSIHFDAQDHPHAMIVAYNTDATTSTALLTEIRRFDDKAMMVSM
jgi:hypothetical protein